MDIGMQPGIEFPDIYMCLISRLGKYIKLTCLWTLSINTI